MRFSNEKRGYLPRFPNEKREIFHVLSTNPLYLVLKNGGRNILKQVLAIFFLKPAFGLVFLHGGILSKCVVLMVNQEILPESVPTIEPMCTARILFLEELHYFPAHVLPMKM